MVANMSSGPRPITRAEYSGPNTPSLLSRAGSPTLPLGNDEINAQPRPPLDQMRRGSTLGGMGGMSALDEKRELRKGQFIGSVDCGTT